MSSFFAKRGAPASAWTLTRKAHITPANRPSAKRGDWGCDAPQKGYCGVIRQARVSAWGSEWVPAVFEPTIRFPVTCPECGSGKLTDFPITVVVDALRKDTNICLVATCHDTIWDASAVEVEQIREYLGAIWLDAQR